MNNQNEQRPWWATCGIIIAVTSTALGILIYLLILLNSTFAVSELEDFSVNTVVPVALATANEVAGMPTAVTPATPNSPIETDEESYNLILIGNDARSDRVEPDCPTCILVHTDAFVYVNISMTDELQVAMVSIPRELYLHVDGITDSQVSQLYARGGLEWIKTWSEAVLGVEIDGVMTIDMDAFVEVIDKMGGITVLPYETFEDKCGDEFYQYEKYILYRLDGFETLCYARMRMYNPQGYFARQKRHLDILSAIKEELRSEFEDDPLVTSVMMVSIYLEYVETDMSPEFIAQIIGEVAIAFYALSSVDIFHNSISQDMLELYPRPDENSPYLYQPTFVISDWVQCLLDTPFECAVE